MDYRDPAPDFQPVPEDFDRNPEEFSEAPEIETTASDEKKEYEYESEEKPSGKKRAGKMKRALLIQAAGVMAGAVLVLDSFGVDILGEDLFFGGEEHWEEPTEYVDPWETDEPGTEEPTEPDERTVEDWPQRDSKWPTRVRVTGHVTYVPSGETFDYEFEANEDDSYDEGMREAKLWVQAQGGDPDSLTLVEAKNVPVEGLQLSEDAIVAGSGDSPERMELLHGEAWWACDREEWYEAFETAEDDAFPDLPNKGPDTEGKYAWSVYYGDEAGGPEEYVMLDGVPLHASAMMAGGDPVVSGSTTGAYYDILTNTLTLENYHGHRLETNLMGNGFRIRLVGENSLDSVRIWGAVYGGSVTFTGDGSITVNGSRTESTGIQLSCEGAASAIMIDSNATVEAYGEQAAVLVHLTRLSRAIYTKREIAVTGGVPSQGAFVSYDVGGEAWTVKEIAKNNGLVGGQPFDGWVEILQHDLGEGAAMALYDYSIVGSDGTPATHVRFAPR